MYDIFSQILLMIWKYVLEVLEVSVFAIKVDSSNTEYQFWGVTN